MPDAALRIHLDLVGGLAGDMFVAAALDAFPAHRAPLVAALAGAGLGLPAGIGVVAHRGASLLGSRFVVPVPPSNAAPAIVAGGRDGYRRGGHVSHAAIVDRLRRATVGDGVRAHALAIFGLLADAEAAVHGIDVAAVEFHEVGAIDSLADIVAAAYLIDAIGPATWTHGAIPLGGGVVRTEHGVMPVPAPATLRLLEGCVVVDDGVPGERVTPTGAAILRHVVELSPRNRRGGAAERVGASGLGFGTRTLPDRPNAVRLTAYAQASGSPEAGAPLPDDWVDTLEFDVDDQTGEDLAVGLDALRARADVLQVVQSAVVGKKGRLASRIHVVARAGSSEAVARACFVQTTTIGLRWRREQRFVVPRRSVQVDRGGGGPRVGVKLSVRDGATTAKVEMDDVANEDGGHAARERARADAQRLALAEVVEPHGDPRAR